MKIDGSFGYLTIGSLALALLHPLRSTAGPVGTFVRASPILPNSQSLAAWQPNQVLPNQRLPRYKPSPKSLGKRMMPSFPSSSSAGPSRLHQAHFVSFTIITPVATAARVLGDFYAEIATLASTVWASTPELSEFAWTQGSFRLNFKCIGDTIPWTFVKNMAEMLWKAACLQATDLFEVIYMDEFQKVGVKVWLEIIQRSGSDPTNGDREGSPPSITSPGS